MLTLVKKRLGVERLEPHVYSAREYQKLALTIGAMVRGGVVIFARKGSGKS